MMDCIVADGVSFFSVFESSIKWGSLPRNYRSHCEIPIPVVHSCNDNRKGADLAQRPQAGGLDYPHDRNCYPKIPPGMPEGGGVSSGAVGLDWFAEVRCYWGLATIEEGQLTQGAFREGWDVRA